MLGRLLRIDAPAARVVRAVLSVYPLDTFVDDAAARMEIVGDPARCPPVQREVQAEIDAAEGKAWPMISIERYAFYERAKQAYAVIQTGERRFYGCFAFRKGVIPPDALRWRGVVILGVFVADTAYRAERHAADGRDHPRAELRARAGRQGLEPGGGGGAARRPRSASSPGSARTPSATWRCGPGQEAGVTPAVTRVPESYTGAAFIFVDAGSGDNAIIISPGAAATIAAADLDAQAALIRRRGGLHDPARAAARRRAPRARDRPRGRRDDDPEPGARRGPARRRSSRSATTSPRTRPRRRR